MIHTRMPKVFKRQRRKPVGGRFRRESATFHVGQKMQQARSVHDCG
jgi:hypothetical protein